jgi:hypothetical protein
VVTPGELNTPREGGTRGHEVQVSDSEGRDITKTFDNNYHLI